MTTWGVVSPVLGSITNGGFESGNFSSWNRSGFLKTGGIPSSLPRNYQTFQAAIGSSPSATENNGVEASQVAAFANGTAGTSPISPTEGNFMAFVSNITSAGNIAVLTGSAISQSFVVPVGGKALTFDVRMLNIDSVSGLSQYDDFAGVALTQGSTILSQFNINLDSAVAADAHVTASASIGGFLNSTPWISRSINVAPLQGQSVTLTAYVASVNDNYAETRLLVDNIRLSVPEPSAFVIMAIGAVTLLSKRRLSA